MNRTLKPIAAIWILAGLCFLLAKLHGQTWTNTTQTVMIYTNGVVSYPGSLRLTSTLYAPGISSSNAALYVTGNGGVIVLSPETNYVILTKSGAPTATAFGVLNDTNSLLSFSVGLDGKLSWGDGSNALDVTVYRANTNVLTTDDELKLAAGSATLPPLLFVAGTSVTNLSVHPGAVEWDGTEITVIDSATTNRQDFVQSAYGELFDFNGQSLTLTNAGTFYGFTSLTQGLVKYMGLTDNAAADRLTVSSGGSGAYRLHVTGSWYGTAGMNAQFRVYKSGIALTNMAAVVQMDAGQTVSPFTMTGITTLTVGDYLDVRVTGDGASNSVTAFFNLSATRIDR